jgi:hypothetical protein
MADLSYAGRYITWARLPARDSNLGKKVGNDHKAEEAPHALQ